MIKKFSLFFFLSVIIYAGNCYSVLTETGLFTPVYPYNIKNNFYFRKPTCNLLQENMIFDTNLSYVGCYTNYKDANYTLHNLKFNFKHPMIVKHKITLNDQYIVFPKNSHVERKNIDKTLQKYKPEKLINKFPENFYGNGIKYINIEKIVFIPAISLYAFYQFYKKHNLSRKVMVLYNGVYSIDYLYKKINNSDILQKLSKNTYILKVPVYVSPTAKFVINNKTLLLETTPKPIFIMYNGNIYAKNSSFIAWNTINNVYDKREYIPKNEMLLIGLQKPRPYFCGLSGSKTYFINNVFKGLGFHSTFATFGISLAHISIDLILNKYSLLSYLNNLGYPQGYYIGNTMIKNMMGFYCAKTKDTVLVGNLMYDNLIYNIDPHDYSKNLIIARNITANAKHAHGIVISRQVHNTVIAQNMSFGNHSAGIMLDRLSYHNLLYDNISFFNGFMGMSIQESDDVLIYRNKLIGNGIDGLIIRNSLKNTVKNNYIAFNGKSGVEVLTKNIDGTIYRDFLRDPYHKATSAVLTENNIAYNSIYNVFVKNNAAVYLYKNKIKTKYGINYGGNLNIFTPEINKNKDVFKLYGIGFPFRAISIDLKKMNKQVINNSVQIYLNESCRNKQTSNILGKIFYIKFKNTDVAKNEFIRGISQLRYKDMISYGYLLLYKAKTKKENIIAVSYLIEGAVFGNQYILYEISQLPYILPISKEDINEAYEIMIKRLKAYKVVYETTDVKCEMNEKKRIEIQIFLKNFLYKIKHSKTNDFYSFCKKQEGDFTVFTQKTINNIKKIYKLSNKPKTAYYKKLLKEKETINDTKECKLISIRLKRKKEDLAKYYLNNKKKIFKVIYEYIDPYLKNINIYRIKKINKNFIYKLMQEQE